MKSLSSLRFILIVMIFLHHCNLYQGGGDLAVTGFFILSGFLITCGYGKRIDTSSFSYRQYILRRVFRIVPLHWLCLCVSVLLIWHAGMLKTVSLSDFAVNMFLLQSYVPSLHIYYSFNSLSWFLSSLFLFYILFPYLYRKRSYAWLLFVAYAILIFVVPQKYTMWTFYICPLVRLADCLLGMYLAILCERKIQSHTYTSDYIVVLLITFQIIISQMIPIEISLHACVYWPLYVLIFVLVGTKQDSRGFLSNNYLSTLGSYVFEIYLVHQICITMVSMALCRFDLYSTWLVCIVSIVVTVIVSWLVHRFFTTPIFVSASNRFGLHQRC